jgi:hypothetical protein
MLMDQQDMSLRVDRAVSPSHPVRTIAGGVVVIQMDMHGDPEMMATSILEGEVPFVTAAMNALTHWTFSSPPTASVARTSVTFFFRPRSPYPMKVLKKPVSPWSVQEDRPALPIEAIDPGYPMMSSSEGVVIFEVGVGVDGRVTYLETVDGIAGLTEHAGQAVKNWKFSPASIAGKPAPSSAIVVISFVSPI